MAFGFDDVLGIASAAGPIIGGLLTQQGQEATNAANSAQSQAQMDFQERMSSTAYQRAVKDMQAAGLNPMLAYTQGGASTPGGAMAQMQNSLGAGVSSALQGSQNAGQIQLMKDQGQLLRAQTENQASQGELYRAQAEELRSRIPTTGALGLKYKQDVETGAASAAQLRALAHRITTLLPYERDTEAERPGQIRAQGFHHAAEAGRTEQFTSLGGVKADIARAIAHARALGAGAALDEYAASGARREAAINESWYGAGRPLLKDLSSLVHSGSSAVRAASGLRLNRYIRTGE